MTVTVGSGLSLAGADLSADELANLDRRHLIRSLHHGGLTDRTVIVRGEGAYVWDAEGNQLLDAAGGGVWHSPLGHGRADLAEIAAEQMKRIEYFTSTMEFSNDQAIRFAARLVELAPEGLNRVAFSSGGSEAVETAIKAARLYHTYKGEPDRTWILSRHFTYHGATYGSGSLTGLPNMHFGIGPNLPNVQHLSPPYPYRSDMFYGGADPTDFMVAELEQTIETIGAGNIAAMIGEPVIAAGGVLTPPDDYWPRMREVLRRHGILLIADEVVTAFGRLGEWFASPRFGMEPDMITMAKGIAGGYMPLAATLMTDEIGETVINGEGGFFHGYTFQGHPVACALGLATADVIEREGLLDNAKRISGWLSEGLAPAIDLPVVGDIRVEGTLAAVELVTDKESHNMLDWGAVINAAIAVRKDHGVVARPYGPNLVLAPPLIFDEAQTRRATEAVIEVISRVQGDGSIKPR